MGGTGSRGAACRRAGDRAAWSVSKRTSRSRASDADRVMSRKVRDATVMSHAVVGGRRARHVERAWISASCTASLGRREVCPAVGEDAEHAWDEPRGSCSSSTVTP